MATEEEEVGGLEKVLTRLAMTEDDKLEKILSKLIPTVIGTLKTSHEKARKKALEILAHVNKRLKSLPKMVLPLESLAAMFADPTSTALVRNFSLVYSEMAFERASTADRVKVVPLFMSSLASLPAAQRSIMLRMLLKALEGPPPYQPPPSPGPLNPNAPAPGPLIPCTSDPSSPDCTILLQHLLKVLLYQPRSLGRGPKNPREAGLAAMRQRPQEEVEHLVGGLSAADLVLLEEKGAPTPEVLANRKLGVLSLLSSSDLPPRAVLLHYLAAADDPAEQVAKRAEELLKKACALDSSKPAVDLEDPELVRRLMALFHGTTVMEEDSVPEPQRIQPAGPLLRCRLMSLFLRSIAAANLFPTSIATIHECVYGHSTSPRLRQLGLELTVWVSRHAAAHHLKAVGGEVLESLLKTLDRAGGKYDNASNELRSAAYTAIGCLASRVPQLTVGRADLAQRFFSALADEPPGVRATVQEALSGLASAFQVLAPADLEEIVTLLLQCVKSAKDAVRLCAAQWAVRLFSPTHAPSRYVAIIAAGDVRPEVRAEGLKGLNLKAVGAGGTEVARMDSKEKAAAASTSSTTGKEGESKPEAETSGASDMDVEVSGAVETPKLNEAMDVDKGEKKEIVEAYPDLGEMLMYLKRKISRFGEGFEGPRTLVLPAKSYVALLAFLRLCKHSQKSIPESALTAYVHACESALTSDAGRELTVVALEALVEVAAEHRGSSYTPTVSHLLPLLAHVDPSARLAAARLVGHVSKSISPEAVSTLLQTLRAAFPPASSPAQSAGVPSAAVAKATAATLGTKFEEREGSLLATGFIIAQLPKDIAPVLCDSLPVALSSLADATSASDTQLAAAAALSLGHASLTQDWENMADVKALGGPAPMSVDEPLPLSETRIIEQQAEDSNTPAEAESSKRLKADASPAADASASPASESLATRVVTRVGALMQDKDVKVVTRAVAAAGYLCYGLRGNKDVKVLLDALLTLASNKTEGVTFAVGEALAWALGCGAVPAASVIETNFTSLADAVGILKGEEMELPAGTASATTEEKPGNFETAIQAVLDKILNDLVLAPRAELRCSGVVWLVSLLAFCGVPKGPAAPMLQDRLSRIQSSLSGLLGDSNELTQEMASRGVCLVYEMGGEGLRGELVKALVGVLQGGVQARAAVKLTGDTQVFEEGALGEVPSSNASSSNTSGGSSGTGGGLSTYKELCALATDLGQPDLIYKFMDLAHHQAALNSRRGAAFGFAGIAKRVAGEELAQHVAPLVPKLYRYLYDPNPRVAEAMTAIWRALVDEPRATLNARFHDVMRELLAEMGGRLWRNRQAAVAAAAELLQGRRWSELEPHFGTLWLMVLRTLDDVKESVRQAALGLARSVRGITLRLVDPQHSKAEEAQAAVAVALPILLDKGVASNVDEVRVLAVDTVAKLVKAAGAEQVRPQLVTLVQVMLESLSSLEDSRLNYVEQHAGRLGLDAERLESVRLSASRSTPMADTLDLAARYVDAASLETLAPALAGLVRRGVGLNTKVGTSRFIKSLSSRMGSELKPATALLLKALVAGVVSERSGAIRRAFASAAAAVVMHAGEKRQARFVVDAVALYTKDEGADHDDRFASGLLLRDLLRSVQDVFTANAAAVLPTAFIAKADTDTDVQALWKEIWEEGAGSESGALRLYLPEISGKVLEGLASAQWGRKKASAEAVSVLAKVSGEDLGSTAAALASALIAEAGGRLWDGKEAVLTALGDLAAGAPKALAKAEDGAVAERVVDALIAAGQRKKKVFVKAALAALARALASLPGDRYSRIRDMVLTTLKTPDASSNDLESSSKADEPPSTSSAAAPSNGSKPSGDEEGPSGSAVMVEVLECVTESIKAMSDATLKDHGAELLECLITVLEAPHAWQVRNACVAALKAFIARSTTCVEPSQALLKDALPNLLRSVAIPIQEIKVLQVRSACLELARDVLVLKIEDAVKWDVRKLHGVCTDLSTNKGMPTSLNLLASEVMQLCEQHIFQS